MHDDYKPMQGLADWLRAVAETQAKDAEQEACMRQWAREVDAASGVTEAQPLPLFAVAVARRKWESLQAEGYRMQSISFARSIDGHERRGSIDPWGKVLWDAHGVTPSDERQKFEAAMGEALKADQGEYALSRAHLPGQPYTFLATKWAWSAWQRALGVMGTGSAAGHSTSEFSNLSTQAHGYGVTACPESGKHCRWVEGECQTCGITAGVMASDPLDKLRRCSLGCLEYGQCKANMHGTPSECASGVEEVPRGR